VTDGWTVSGTGVAASGQFLFGNEANLTAKTPADFVFNLHTSYQLTPTLQLFGLIENAFNTTYYHLAPFHRPHPFRLSRLPAPPIPRSYSPGATIAGTVGIRMTF
jgi:iron complex outermembrane recepter protein